MMTEVIASSEVSSRRRAPADISFWLPLTVALFLYIGFIAVVAISALLNIDRTSFCAVIYCPQIKFAIKLSIITATISAALSMLIAIPSAYALSNYQGRGKTIIDTLLDLPLVLPPIGLGFLLLVFLTTPVGEAIQRNFVRFAFETPGIVLAQFTVASGFAMRVLKSSFDSLNPRYDNVARTLGFSKWQSFSRIVLPLSKNGLIAGAVLTWARCMGEFGATMIVAGAFAMKTEVLPISIFLSWQTAQIKQGLCVTLILVAVSLTALFLFKKISGRRHI